MKLGIWSLGTAVSSERLKAVERSTKEPLIDLNKQKEKFKFKCKKKKRKKNELEKTWQWAHDKQKSKMLLQKKVPQAMMMRIRGDANWTY